MSNKCQQLVGMEDENNNNNNGSCPNLNLIVTSSPSPTQSKKRQPIPLDAQLVGDDLFRSLVTRDASDNRSKWACYNLSFASFSIILILTPDSFPNIKKIIENGVQQIGFCVSGQTIASAAKQIELAHYFKASHLILNVGSVDILNGQSLDDMCADFDHLIRVCEQRGCVPIVATLAPLADGHRASVIHDKLMAFNFYLVNKYSTGYPFIDIWQQIAMRNGRICLGFYERYAFSPWFAHFSKMILLSVIRWEHAYLGCYNRFVEYN